MHLRGETGNVIEQPGAVCGLRSAACQVSKQDPDGRRMQCSGMDGTAGTCLTGQVGANAPLARRIAWWDDDDVQRPPPHNQNRFAEAAFYRDGQEPGLRWKSEAVLRVYA